MSVVGLTVVCGFLVFQLQIAIEPFVLFHQTGFDYLVHRMTQTVANSNSPLSSYVILPIAQNKYLGIF